MQKILTRIFKLDERKAKISEEIIAGIIAFFAILYTLPVNSSLIAKSGISVTSAFTTIALTCAISTFLVGIVTNRPFIVGFGAGMNTFFVYTLTTTLGYTWQEGLSIILITSIIFFILSISGLRTKIIDAIDPNLKAAISAALGLFLAFIGLNMGGIIVRDDAGLIKLGSLDNPLVLLSLFGIFLVLILSSLKGKISRFAIIIAMLTTALFGFILGLLNVENMPKFDFSLKVNFKETPFVAFFNFGVLKNLKTYIVIISCLFIELFDATGSLVAIGSDLNLLSEDGKLIDGKKIMVADATAQLITNSLGGLSAITFAESAIAAKNGGKTGLTSCVISILMLFTLIAYPLFSIFSPVTVNGESFSPTSALALIYVGIMLFSNIEKIDFKSPIIAFTSFIIITMTIFSYSLVNGLGMGFTIYVLLMLVNKKGKDVNFIIYLISLLYIFSFVIDYLLV